MVYPLHERAILYARPGLFRPAGCEVRLVRWPVQLDDPHFRSGISRRRSREPYSSRVLGSGMQTLL